MNVRCKACGEPVPHKNIDMQSYAARCDACDVVFSAEKQIDQKTELKDGELLFPLRDSEDIDVARFDDDLYITRRWKRPSAGHLIVAIGGGVFIPLAFLVLMVTGAAPELVDTLTTWLMCLVPFWLVFSYFQVANLMNATEIIVVNGELILRHGPVPGWHSGRVSTENITQFFCKTYVETYDSDSGVTTRTTNYSIHFESQNGRQRQLIDKLANLEQAICIERLLERHLDIDDRRVRGDHNQDM